MAEVFCRYSCLMCLLIGLACTLRAQDPGPTHAPQSVGPNLQFNFGLGLDSETGRPLALEPECGLGLRVGPFFTQLGASSATDGNLLDRLAFQYGWRFRAHWLNASVENMIAWRSYGADGDETRLGLVLRADFGTMSTRMGVALRTIIGYSVLKTRIPALDLSWVDQDPILGIGIVWFSGTGWELSTSVSDFGLAEASLWLKTFFIFGVTYQCPQWRIQTELLVKYSDWFTLTGFADGLALRVSGAVPITGVLE